MGEALAGIFNLINGVSETITLIVSTIINGFQMVGDFFANTIEAIGEFIGTVLSFFEFWTFLMSAFGQTAILPASLLVLLQLVLTCVVLKLLIDVFT